MFSSPILITNKGKALQAKVQAGATLTYTRIAIGDGSLSGQAIADLNNLINEKKTIAITRVQPQAGGMALVGGLLSNQTYTTGFYLREIGVFAQDPDVGEILYCYGNDGTGAEYIHAGGGSTVIERNLNILTLTGNAASVSATINSSLVFATQIDLTNHISATTLDHPDGSVKTAKIADKAVTGSKIADNAIGSGQLGAGAATDTVIGNRTADPNTSTAYGNTGTVTQLFSWIWKYLKSITGKTNPFDAPDITLSATKTHVDTTSGAHGATSVATANKPMQRDVNARAQVADPVAMQDIATKGYVDTQVSAAKNYAP